MVPPFGEPLAAGEQHSIKHWLSQLQWHREGMMFIMVYHIFYHFVTK